MDYERGRGNGTQLTSVATLRDDILHMLARLGQRFSDLGAILRLGVLGMVAGRHVWRLVMQEDARKGVGCGVDGLYVLICWIGRL